MLWWATKAFQSISHILWFCYWCLNNWYQIMVSLQLQLVVSKIFFHLILLSKANWNSILSQIASNWRYFVVSNPLTSDKKEKSIIFLRLSCRHRAPYKVIAWINFASCMQNTYIHRSAESTGLRLDSSWRLRFFSLSHTHDKMKNIFLYFFTKLKNLPSMLFPSINITLLTLMILAVCRRPVIWTSQ